MNVKKAGHCPLPPMDGPGTCQVECASEEDCPGLSKCCSNGCGQVCLAETFLSGEVCGYQIFYTVRDAWVLVSYLSLTVPQHATFRKRQWRECCPLRRMLCVARLSFRNARRMGPLVDANVTIRWDAIAPRKSAGVWGMTAGKSTAAGDSLQPAQLTALKLVNVRLTISFQVFLIIEIIFRFFYDSVRD